jgi:hypothetical protein
MKPYEVLSLLISLTALAVSLWNYRRISCLDEKEEYKNKSNLFHDAYAEAKSLAEKIDSEVATINGLRINLTNVKSHYIDSAGYSHGDESLLKNIKEVNSIKAELLGICEELNGVTKKDDRVAFDRCMEIKRLLKDKSGKITEVLGQAKITINSMCSMAEAQKK